MNSKDKFMEIENNLMKQIKKKDANKTGMNLDIEDPTNNSDDDDIEEDLDREDEDSRAEFVSTLTHS